MSSEDRPQYLGIVCKSGHMKCDFCLAEQRCNVSQAKVRAEGVEIDILELQLKIEGLSRAERRAEDVAEANSDADTDAKTEIQVAIQAAIQATVEYESELHLKQNLLGQARNAIKQAQKALNHCPLCDAEIINTGFGGVIGIHANGSSYFNVSSIEYSSSAPSLNSPCA
ncbi:hypothetical protein NEDG_01740 [Nematocida displodere]|uniref:Uncharacterized protein n=1 Tax=Nematocida displodere TaxID=1805483 RepID=A0A177EDY8_9MICR|nr:hypothetical protein NEDG_01740 [Nematocida displodere]